VKKPLSISASIPLAPAELLVVHFIWCHDRWGHQLEWRHDHESILLATTVEGDDKQEFPPSPPIQDMSVEHRSGGAVALGVGMAGAAMWSFSAEAKNDQGVVEFDWACQPRGMSLWPRQHYRLHCIPLSSGTAGTSLVEAPHPQRELRTEPPLAQTRCVIGQWDGFEGKTRTIWLETDDLTPMFPTRYDDLAQEMYSLANPVESAIGATTTRTALDSGPQTSRDNGTGGEPAVSEIGTRPGDVNLDTGLPVLRLERPRALTEPSLEGHTSGDQTSKLARLESAPPLAGDGFRWKYRIRVE
jgi:hypothetical protein